MAKSTNRALAYDPNNIEEWKARWRHAVEYGAYVQKIGGALREIGAALTAAAVYERGYEDGKNNLFMRDAVF